MKKPAVLFILVLMLFIPSLIKAQGIVEIIEDPDISTAVQNRINYCRANTLVKGYRIMIGYYNSRSTATREQSNAITLYGKDHITKLKYDEPNWKVFVGEFEEKADAEAALRLIRKKYPSARIIEDTISSIPPANDTEVEEE